MKNILISLALLSTMYLSSCTKMIYTQDQVLDNYKSKEEVSKRFGKPDQKKINNENEEWLYVFETSEPYSNRSISYGSTTTTEVNELGDYDKYLLFDFDKQGTVTYRRTEGVDFATRKKAPIKTAIMALSGTLIIGIVAMILLINSYHLDRI